jgi:allantoate deiminase
MPAWAVCSAGPSGELMVTQGVNGRRLLDRLGELAAIGARPGGGITRLAWSPEDRQAVDLVAGWAREAGATVWIDSVGNVIAERPGADQSPPLVTGSHLDTVVDGGPLDGAYGVVAGIEVLTHLEESGTVLRHPLRVVAFVNEEGVVAPPFTGSRAVVGRVDPAELAWPGPDATPLSARMEAAGCDPSGLARASWPTAVSATIELHIEQGPVLETAGKAIGVVTAVTSQYRGSIAVTGETNHAGTTPMALRRDALVAAARLVLAVQDVAVDGPAEVATVGRLQVRPSVANVIPGRVHMSFDLRATDEERCRAAVVRLRRRAEAIAVETGTTVTVDALPPTPGVAADDQLRRIITEAAHAAGLSTLDTASGAGHDCANLAPLGPVAMLFVPSMGGVSHSAVETTPPADLVDGAGVLLEALRRADRILDP